MIFNIRKFHSIVVVICFQVTLFLELADAYRISGQNQEATRTMQDALTEFQGTPEEIR